MTNIASNKKDFIARSSLRKENTRRAILDAAEKMFSEHGFDKTNVSDIVKSVDVAQGTFYYHFPDKKSILIELLEEFFSRARELVDNWAGTSDTGEEIAYVFAKNVASLIYENRSLARIVMKEAHSSDTEIRNCINEFYQYLYGRTERALELGMVLGVVRPLDAGVVAVAFVGMIKEVVFDLLDADEPVDLEVIIAEISRLQNFGIRP